MEQAPETDLTKLTLEQLHHRIEVATGMAATTKYVIDATKTELARRFAESAKQALAQQKKTHGTVSLPLQDGFTAKGEAKQTVKWDSDKLQAIAATLPWERVAALFSIKFSMSETIYKGIEAAAPELRLKIDEARTTTVAEPTIVLVKAA